MKRLLLLILLISCSTLQAQSLYDKALTFQFNASGNSQIKELDITNTWHLLPGHPWQSKEFAYGVQSAPKPAGKTTHAMSFWFRSNGYFSSIPGDSDHLAFMLKGEWRQGFIRGRGMIINGDSPTHPTSLDPSSTFETWDYSTMPGGHVWMDKYLYGLLDNTWYQVTMHVNSYGTGYDIHRQDGSLLYAQSVNDTYYPNLPENLGGWFILATNGSGTTNWTISFSDLQIWWF